MQHRTAKRKQFAVCTAQLKEETRIW